MTEPSKAQAIDTDLAKHCAFSFPAVALTLGAKNWDCLRDTYELLAADMQVCTMENLVYMRKNAIDSWKDCLELVKYKVKCSTSTL